MAFVKDAKGISFKNRLKGHINWRKVRHFNVIGINLFQPIKKPVRTLSIFKSMAFVKDAKWISFKNRLKGHINWRKVRNYNVI
jgi:hypothetical protein